MGPRMWLALFLAWQLPLCQGLWWVFVLVPHFIDCLPPSPFLKPVTYVGFHRSFGLFPVVWAVFWGFYYNFPPSFEPDKQDLWLVISFFFFSFFFFPSRIFGMCFLCAVTSGGCSCRRCAGQGCRPLQSWSGFPLSIFLLSVLSQSFFMSPVPFAVQACSRVLCLAGVCFLLLWPF